MSERVITAGRVGHKDAGVGDEVELRTGYAAELVTGNLHGKYTELSRQGKIYFAASQAATTWTIALAATYTGLVVYNPAGSGKNLSILQATLGLSVAPAGIAHIGLFVGGNAAGNTVHTTPLTVYNAFLNGAAGAGKADAAATLVGTPVWFNAFMGGFTAGSLPSTSPAVIDVNGMITVPPGWYCGIAALTVVVGFASMAWTEIPIGTP
jgi:hypothetical protein